MYWIFYWGSTSTGWIFNQSFDQLIFPDDFKFADITAAFKANEPPDKNNYRPISVLSVLSKVFERIMNEQLSHYFNHILSTLISVQFFEMIIAVRVYLLKMIEDWKSALDK